MPFVKDEKPMASNAIVSGADAPGEDEPGEQRPSRQGPPPARVAAHQGFFTIYKKGQGKWTRLGTVFAAIFIAGLTAYFLSHDYLPKWIHGIHGRKIILGITVGFLVVYGLLVYWIMNKPHNADFLIATDSEMKKVNWTTQGELFGSTKVVIFFLFFTAIFLFVFDILFAELFHLISVLRTGPFQ